MLPMEFTVQVDILAVVPPYVPSLGLFNDGKFIGTVIYGRNEAVLDW